MTTTHASKFQRFGRPDWSKPFRRSVQSNDDPHKHILPGIGTFVIDSPRDNNMRVRQECLKYQEAHRGILRERIDSLPDIPKRCDMKSLPVVRFHDLAGDQKKEVTSQSPQNEDYREQNDRRESTLSNIRRLEQNLLSRKESNTNKLPSKEELLSRSPLRNVTPLLSARPSFGFKRNKPETHVLRTEFTNLTMNIELSTPEPVICKATEKELSSQAEYRRQLSYYMNHMVSPERTPEGSACKSKHRNGQSNDSDDENDLDTNRSLVTDLPPHHMGHTSRHNLWESHRRLKELILKQGAPCSKSKTYSPQQQNMIGNSFTQYEQKKRGIATNNNIPRRSIVSSTCIGSNRHRLDDSDDVDMDIEDWTSMANTPVIDSGMYDRYANIRRPASRGGNRSLQNSRTSTFGTVPRGLACSPQARIHGNLKDSPYLAQQTRTMSRS